MTPKQAQVFLNKCKRVRVDSGTLASEYPGVFATDDGVFSTNGHVMHVWRGEYTGELSDNAPDIGRVNLGECLAKVAITKEHLKRAIKNCKAFRPTSIIVEVNSRMELRAAGDDGDAIVRLVSGDVWLLGKRQKASLVLYRHVGMDLSFAIDPKYMWDATMAMDDIVIVELFQSGVKLHSEQASAWIMNRVA